jgi:hypothetical protein
MSSIFVFPIVALHNVIKLGAKVIMNLILYSEEIFEKIVNAFKKDCI